MTTQHKDHVVVVGMGPVGMVAALNLAQRGISVTVLEAGPTLAEESRASTFHPPSLEYLARLGVADDLHAVGLRAPNFQHRDRQGGVLIDLDLTLLEGETPYPYRLQSEQDNLTRIVHDRLAGMGNVELIFSAPVEAVENTADGAVVRIAGRSEPIRADWVVGADGASSAVRKSLAIDFDGLTYPERFLVISTTYDFREAIPDLAYVAYISDPQEWLVLLRTPRHWRALFPVADAQDEREIARPEAVDGLLQRVHPRSEPYPVLHTTLYNVHQRIAGTMALGRVLLAGDAAHINNPLGGLGMNSGIHDAMGAAATIVAAIEGADPAACAAAYAQVRRATVENYVLAATARNFSDLSDSDEDLRAARAARLAALASDPEAQREEMRRTSMLASAHRSKVALAEALAEAAPSSARH